MKETIEWFSVSESTPDEAVLVLVKQDDDILPVIPAAYSVLGGFLSVFGKPHNPSMWCYFPKGEQ